MEDQTGNVERRAEIIALRAVGSGMAESLAASTAHELHKEKIHRPLRMPFHDFSRREPMDVPK
jgi:hypothetical protein